MNNRHIKESFNEPNTPIDNNGFPVRAIDLVCCGNCKNRASIELYGKSFVRENCKLHLMHNSFEYCDQWEWDSWEFNRRRIFWFDGIERGMKDKGYYDFKFNQYNNSEAEFNKSFSDEIKYRNKNEI